MAKYCPTPQLAESRIKDILPYLPVLIEFRQYQPWIASELLLEVRDLESSLDTCLLLLNEGWTYDDIPVEGELYRILDCVCELRDRICEYNSEDEDDGEIEFEEEGEIAEYDRTPFEDQLREL